MDYGKLATGDKKESFVQCSSVLITSHKDDSILHAILGMDIQLELVILSPDLLITII